MNFRENFIRTITFGYPEWLHYDIVFSGATWAVYKEELEAVVLRHPASFGWYKPGSVDFKNMHFSKDATDENYVTDAWGCKWHYPLRYMDGVVVGHPLADIAALDTFTPPPSPVPDLSGDALEKEIARVKAAKARGEIVSGGTEHGFLFLRHTYLRGFDNAMFDYADPDAHADLTRIYDMIVDYNMQIVNYNIKRGADYMEFAEDLGTQTGTIISPDAFRDWVKPAYAKLMQPCKKAGMFIGLHSDGKTLDILEDQIEAGVDVVNPQDLCNGIDNLRDRIKGKACIRLDIDRQAVIPYGTPRDIDDLIHEEVEKLGSPAGGLMFICGVYPPTPTENVDALATALEKYAHMWFK
jgi:hypothetical protein